MAGSGWQPGLEQKDRAIGGVVSTAELPYHAPEPASHAPSPSSPLPQASRLPHSPRTRKHGVQKGVRSSLVPARKPSRRLAERDARRLRPAAAGYILLAVLLAIALARYPHLYEWQSASGIAYLIFLATMLLTGTVGLARGLQRASANPPLGPADRLGAEPGAGPV
jgi:hypothetical protein